MRFPIFVLLVLALAVPAFAQVNDDSEKPTDITTLTWPTEYSTAPDPVWVQSVVDDPVSTDSETTTTETAETAPETEVPSTPQGWLDAFMSANEVFAGGEIVPIQLAEGLYSQPKAVVLQCAESMSDAHIIFGQPRGRIAVVRTMANTLPIAAMQPDSVDAASVEYAVLNQGARFIIVLGHTNCEVMQTVVAKWKEIKGMTQVTPGNQAPRGNLPALYQALYPAVMRANRDGGADLLDASVRNNIANSVAALAGDRFNLRRLVQSGELVIVGVIYDPETRKVELLDK